jgi:adenylate cyclase
VTRETCAVAFVDVVDFTAGKERYGDGYAVGIVDALETAVLACLPPDARLVKLLGDGALCVFNDATRAVCAMTDVVARLAALPTPIEARAAVHFGFVTTRGDDVIGHVVNVTARLTASAQPGEVLCSDAVRTLIRDTRLTFASRGVLDLRGVGSGVPVFGARRKTGVHPLAFSQ